MRSLILSLIAVASLAACTETPAETARAAEREAGEQARLAHRLAGLVPGKPQSCLDQFDTRDAQVSVPMATPSCTRWVAASPIAATRPAAVPISAAAARTSS